MSGGPDTQITRVLLIGGGAREHALGEALCRSGRAELFVYAHKPTNPGLNLLAAKYELGEETDVERIVRFAQDSSCSLAVIGLEDPLAVGVPDALAAVGIDTVGPGAAAARVETSKLFLRQLMENHEIAGRVEYRYFDDPDELSHFLTNSPNQYALKPIGLTGGKGVKVMGVQLQSWGEAIEYGRSVIESQLGGTAGLVLEERLLGVEFTLQAFVDGKTLLPLPLVKDYKLAEEGESGPNTGSMGSYSRSDHSLDFVSDRHHAEAVRIMESIVEALRVEGWPYQGIMYGQFMVTSNGVRLVEINARFGDPEAINVLSLMNEDFLDVCSAIVSGRLHTMSVSFANQATVCKYITPPGYPTLPKLGAQIGLKLDAISELGVQVFFAKVAKHEDHYETTSSRSVALLGIADTVEAAQAAVERSLKFVHGDYHLRHDIGTQGLIDSALLALRNVKVRDHGNAGISSHPRKVAPAS